jgi:hypothetical protein
MAGHAYFPRIKNTMRNASSVHINNPNSGRSNFITGYYFENLYAFV